MKSLTVFTGAGVSAESGIKTFRDSGGLWEEYDIMEVATPEAWDRNPKLVLEFYNSRRKQAIGALPNRAHEIIAELERSFKVKVITQNIDDLHERAGSSSVLHLHGEIRKSRSSVDDRLVYEVEDRIEWGEKCELGSQLRPHVVWFGEEVPNMVYAEAILESSDILVVVGTSLNVYPAAGLVYSAKACSRIFVVDPGQPIIPEGLNICWIREKASIGMQIVRSEIEAQAVQD